MRDDVLAYYRLGGETTRLTAGAGRLEFIRTWDVLTRTLPPPPTDVLDVGGATGIYAAPLAAAGYRVHVVDPVPEHVAASAAHPGVTAESGDARSLPVDGDSVDAVLLLGPLYHLLDRADRVGAWREAARVVRPGGVIVAALIARYASLWDGFARAFLAEPGYGDVIDHTLATGEHRPPEGTAWFATAYFHHPDEVAGEVTDAGLTHERTVLVEGPLWMLAGPLPDEATILDRLRPVEEEPSLLGSSSHLLAIARRSR
jgi:SAM-dependent methyltransferase